MLHDTNARVLVNFWRQRSGYGVSMLRGRSSEVDRPLVAGMHMFYMRRIA